MDMDAGQGERRSVHHAVLSTMDASQLSLAEEMSRRMSKTLSFMEKRTKYRVLVDDVDYTPDNVIDPAYVTMGEYFAHAAFESRTRYKSEVGLKTSKSKSATDTGMKVYATTINLDDIHIDHTLNTEEGFIPEDDILSLAPSAFYLPKMTPLSSYPPQIFIVLKETETQFLFELPSISFDKGTPEATLVEEENDYYHYITVGKGRNRKTIPEETQTNEVTTQTRHTLATRPQKKNAIVFASLWDMYDTYARLASIRSEPEPDEMVMYQSAAPNLLRKKKIKSDSNHSRYRGKTFEEIAPTYQFLDAVLLTERVLATLEYSDAQKKFRGLVRMDPLSLELVYIYTMKPLWSFECAETAGRPITSISFNPKNPNILAVGHGKFAYAEYYSGLVCIWCTKNPCKPERIYGFEYPVTSVAFSDTNPNWLACGFSNGDVLILDVTSYTIKTLAKSKRETNPCFEPIWVTYWRCLERGTEFLLTACQDGRINKFVSTKSHDFICSPMMRLATVEGKLRGIETPKACLKVDVPITRYPAALCMRWHPSISHVYFVGTDEGCIHRCSTHYLNQHIDVWRAHAGPVYSVEMSPFMKNLMVSCGADNAIRLWIEGVDEVIMTLMCPAAVYGVTFCPINSTILISVSGNVLSIWDLRRKTHIPCAEYTFPGSVVLTYIKFSASGDNVFVGDTLGRIHTFHLEDTPIPPYDQLKMLDETVKKALCTRPHMIKQLEKLRKLTERNKSY